MTHSARSPSALAAQAELHHPLLLRQEPGVATREGPQVVGDWMFRLFRLFGDGLLLPRLVQAGLGAATTFLTWRIGARASMTSSYL